MNPTSAATLLFCVLFACETQAQAANKYTNRYDNVDVARILGNERVLTNYIKCMMDEGPCTPEGRELKKTLPDALASGCTKCNPKQKENSEKVIGHLMKARGRDWERLTKKYDPQGQYQRRYDELVAQGKAEIKL